MRYFVYASLIILSILTPGCVEPKKEIKDNWPKDCSGPHVGIWLTKDIVKKDENGNDVYDSNGNLVYDSRNEGYIILNSDCTGRFYGCIQDVKYSLPGDGTMKIKFLKKGFAANCPKSDIEHVCPYIISGDKEAITIGLRSQANVNLCHSKDYNRNHDNLHGNYY